jgi:uncharacterized GH25 family protein
MTMPRLKAKWVLLVILAALTVLGIVLGIARDPWRPSSTGPTTPTVTSGRPSATPLHAEAEVSVLVDPDQEGALLLEGQVIDSDEAPVAGATVTLSTHPAREVKSEKDGSFAFTKLMPGRYTLVARAQASYGGPVTCVLHAALEPVVLRLVPAPILRVTVADSRTQQPIQGATIELSGLGLYTQTTGPDGTAILDDAPPGHYALSAWAPGFGKRREPLVLRSEDSPAQVTLGLEPGAGISGRVVTESGTPVAGAWVYYERTSARAWSHIDPMRDGQTSDAQGRFRFESLALGTYRFVTQHEEHGPGVSAPQILDGRADLTEVLIVVPPGASVAGRVIAKDGSPVAAATIRVGPRSEGQPRIRQTRALSDGTFRVSGLSRVPVEVVAITETASSEPVVVDLRTVLVARDVVLTLGLDGVISGTVVDGSGSPIAEAQVVALVDPGQLGSETPNLREPSADVTDASGSFTLRGLAEGEYLVRARRPGIARAGNWLTQPGTVAHTGDRRVKLVLQRGGSIKGRVALDTGESPSLMTVSTEVTAPAPFAKAEFLLSDLPPGNTTLTIMGPGFDVAVVADVAVESDRTTDVGTITVHRGRSITGRVVTRDGKPVEGARVLAGYRVIGDGENLSMESWGPAGQGATKEDTTDAEGNFAFRGVGTRDVAVIAQHPEKGRSRAVKVPSQLPSVDIDLVLIPLGGIEGLVTRGGKPVEGVAVNASPRSMALGSNFVVSSGIDGHYRFERLAADEYVLSAMTGRSPLSGISMNGIPVKVTEGTTTTAPTIVLPANPVTLIVSARLPSQALVPLAEVLVVSGVFSGTTAKDIHTVVDQQAGGFNSFNIVITPRPTKVNNLQAGTYTACVVPFPAGMEKAPQAVVQDYIEHHVDALPIFCKVVEVGDKPEQALTIDVVQPPAPTAGKDEGKDEGNDEG